MRVFDLPRDRSENGRSRRIAVAGTWRLLEVFDELVATGRLTAVWSNGAITPHTLGEVQQILDYNRGEKDVPPEFLPYMFDRAESLAPRSPMVRRLLGDIDAFVIEVSELNQIKCGDWYFLREAFLSRF